MSNGQSPWPSIWRGLLLVSVTLLVPGALALWAKWSDVQTQADFTASLGLYFVAFSLLSSALLLAGFLLFLVAQAVARALRARGARDG